MQLGWARAGKMRLVLLTLALCSSLEGRENSFTINSIHMESLPGWIVPNGWNVTLQCIVDISTTSQVKPQHELLFYKDDVLFYNVSSMESTESYFIPQARVYDSGTYKCTVILNNKEKTTAEFQLSVKGVPSPRVTVDKKEAIEGGIVTVNCSVPEEKPPIHFTIEKFELNTKSIKLKKEKTSRSQNFLILEFPVEEQDHILVFRCQARIISGIHVETSELTRSDLVTVRTSFSIPKFYISPAGVITEGDQLHIRCTIQVTHLAMESPEIIIQKDKAIVANSRHSNEAVYSVMAMVEHNGNYTCKVESSRIAKVSSIVVNITELFSKPKLESSSTRLDQGESLNLSCSIPGAPPVNFTIQKGDTIVSHTPNFTKIASAWDSGTYTCTGAIGKVVKTSSPVQITVCEMLSTPKISHDAKSEIIKGQTIEISCQSINGTSPISYHLLKVNNILESRTTNSNDPVVFKDNPTKDTEYQCIADNCHSHIEMFSNVLRVKVIAPVDEVTLSILLNNMVESGEDITLRCSVNEGSGPITYRFYREKENKHFYQTTVNDTEVFWSKTQASKEQEGQYYCIAFNRANRAKHFPQSNVLTVRVFLAPWKKGLIAVVVIGVIIAALIVGAKCYFLRKAKAKQMPVEMSRTAAPLLNSNEMSDPNTEVNSHYGYNDDVGNHAMKPTNENKEPLTSDVEYTEVEVTPAEPHRALGTKGTETVYSEIRKACPDFVENRYSRTEGSLDGT
ncbi:platelet endothelial cell adhesion molecule isoform X1 [Tupaia chinensis]|uniref:platelet endothelial cell adhesion molecule isoform X1 n=1 Tax=Tupaia chinensis TaxID=246437 RepID=UPI0003C91602|nr:platelet endothelial cell adhesion molecule isoform X1 [Tupaia chinensis]XP_014442662.1 platelet endothelial cell adhesion molecule isoform X1 [Tupaia chinensis]XP_027626973.1 platelet endothelial cell adhesion molecule isoform X1 [Tupaia chinensis]